MKLSFRKRLLLALGLVALIGPVAAAETSTSQSQASQPQTTQQSAPPGNASASSGVGTPGRRCATCNTR
jgi:hypothetical protein